MLHMLYLVHDLHDPAVCRRVEMLLAGGARVTLAGFRRGDAKITDVAGLVPIDLGETADGRFLQRIGAVSTAAVALSGKLAGVSRPDVIIGRNLEMLALAVRARSIFGGAMPVVYECLDIHRLLLRNDPLGRAMRGAERALARRASLLVTSSPAFAREYFEPNGQIDAPVLLLENKVLDLTHEASAAPVPRPAFDKPVRIGWFGALRCRRSLDLLSAFTRAMDGRFEVVLRGRPAVREIPDFASRVAAEPYLSFEGAYRNPEDLPAIYGAVHFTWAIDFFEAGQNSSWLLPNRLYEGCRHGAVPIAMEGTETARFLRDHDLGLVLSEATPDALKALLSDLSPADYARETARVAAQPQRRWVADLEDCRALVTRLGALGTSANGSAIREIAA